MKWLLILWKRWQLHVALEELSTFQASFEVGPLYLANVMLHVAQLDRDIARLSRADVPCARTALAR